MKTRFSVLTIILLAIPGAVCYFVAGIYGSAYMNIKPEASEWEKMLYALQNSYAAWLFVVILLIMVGIVIYEIKKRMAR
ncbi:hypothetical protein CIG75_04115 [Tumebacillus algifaecis]|uniref:Uncharacterized protein n=1 Tax=Tumebacillus algifaecis TaxID=1214604 RepID=A0A223CYU3_9BACL|nr:hypothetical protein CIG75_04115 [Tumebacillus algifaecis]